MSMKMNNLRVLLYSDSREEVTQGLLLLESLVSNYQELVAHVQEITGESSFDDALSAIASYSNGRDVVVWIVRQTHVYEQPYCDLKVSYRVDNSDTWAVEYGASSITKEQYDYWKSQEETHGTSFLSMYIFTESHISYDWEQHDPIFEAIPEPYRFKKSIDEEWYNFTGEYDIDLFAGQFVITESFGHWEFELFSGNLEGLLSQFNLEDNRTPRTTQPKKEGQYFLHVRSVERGVFFGTLSLSEPIDFADLEVNNIDEDWGYNLANVSFDFLEAFERQLDRSTTEDVGAGVTDTVGDIHCANMSYY